MVVYQTDRQTAGRIKEHSVSVVLAWFAQEGGVQERCSQ